MNIGIFGRGRLAQAISSVSNQVVWMTGKNESPPSKVDVAVHAGHPSQLHNDLRWCEQMGTPIIIGTTGWDQGVLDKVKDIGIVVAPNFSLGVAFFVRCSALWARFSQWATDFDPYVIEHHHARKKDAPSGTAHWIANTILQNHPEKTSWRLIQNEPLPEDVLSVSSIRAGTTYSTHWVGLDAPSETLTMEHAARDASCFGRGAILAAEFIQHRSGIYHFQDIANQLLDPIFQEGT